MAKNVTFFHGGASYEDYEADAKLVDSLKTSLGAGYSVHYPLLPNDGSPDLGRRKQIIHEISSIAANAILVGHSLGASMLLACLSENSISKQIAGIFLLATPFWHGNEEWVNAFKLKTNFAEHLDKQTPLFLYHCHDDEEVPIHHMDIYRQHLPWATFHPIKTGGHQMNNDLTLVAQDIKTL